MNLFLSQSRHIFPFSVKGKSLQSAEQQRLRLVFRNPQDWSGDGSVVRSIASPHELNLQLSQQAAHSYLRLQLQGTWHSPLACVGILIHKYILKKNPVRLLG